MTKWIENKNFLLKNLYIRPSLARINSQSECILASETQIYRFFDFLKVVICHPLCRNINMWKLLITLAVMKLYARIDI